MRTAQATNGVEVANSFLRANRQINGILTDTNGATVANIADPGPEAGGVYFAGNISFEKDGAQVDPKDVNGDVVTSFASVLFGGIPNANGDGTDLFADESVALVTLEPGTYTLPSARTRIGPT